MGAGEGEWQRLLIKECLVNHEANFLQFFQWIIFSQLLGKPFPTLFILWPSFYFFFSLRGGVVTQGRSGTCRESPDRGSFFDKSHRWQ